MKRTVGLAVLIGICGLFLMAGGVFAADLEIGCAIYKFDDTFMTGVRNAIAEAAKGKAKVDIVDSRRVIGRCGRDGSRGRRGGIPGGLAQGLADAGRMVEQVLQFPETVSAAAARASVAAP